MNGRRHASAPSGCGEVEAGAALNRSMIARRAGAGSSFATTFREGVIAMGIFSARLYSSLIARGTRMLLAIAALGAIPLFAQSKPSAPNPVPDVLVLTNGDTLHGKFVGEVSGKVTFHSDPLGDLSISWDKIKELHVAERFGVLDSQVIPKGRHNEGQIPVGTFDVSNQAVTVHPGNAAASEPIPVKDAQYIMDEAALSKQVYHQPSFFAGWSGPATVGATLVTATQNQYTVSGAIGLVRAVPTVSWLNPRDRTSLGFSGSFGKITQPAYVIPGPPPATVAAVTSKTAIYHAAAERDEYFSRRFFALGQVAFDHNFSQDLGLQQIYGGGIGWTAIKTPKQALDVKATMQYEKQQFISGASGTNQNLVGSTFSAAYELHKKLLTFAQELSFIPAYNNTAAYSANETNTFAFPAFKGLSFSLGTLDSYLNDPPATLPPTKGNSFQFTMGLTYAIKSKY
ncbi:MAG: DUF481 domain-containing protein [Terracidiphilus sp.]